MQIVLAEADQKTIQGLAEVTCDVVNAGASVGFMLPFTREDAVAFWQKVFKSAERGDRTVLVAKDKSGTILGTVQLVTKMPDNQPHRADVAKMQVRTSAQRQGIGAALLKSVEQLAREQGKTLLVLDTVTGGDGERLYAKQGWQRCGVIPNYALFPNGGYCSTTVFYKQL